MFDMMNRILWNRYSAKVGLFFIYFFGYLFIYLFIYFRLDLLRLVYQHPFSEKGLVVLVFCLFYFCFSFVRLVFMNLAFSLKLKDGDGSPPTILTPKKKTASKQRWCDVMNFLDQHTGAWRERKKK